MTGLNAIPPQGEYKHNWGDWLNKKQIHEAIKDYPWMMKMIIKKREQSSNGLTAQYGIEATLPKPKGVTSDPVYQEVIRFERRDRDIKRIRDKVLFIQERSKVITDTRDRVILDMLLDGMTLREISMELETSISNINKRKINIVNTMHEVQKVQKV